MGSSRNGRSASPLSSRSRSRSPSRSPAPQGGHSHQDPAQREKELAEQLRSRRSNGRTSDVPPAPRSHGSRSAARSHSRSPVSHRSGGDRDREDDNERRRKRRSGHGEDDAGDRRSYGSEYDRDYERRKRRRGGSEYDREPPPRDDDYDRRRSSRRGYSPGEDRPRHRDSRRDDRRREPDHDDRRNGGGQGGGRTREQQEQDDAEYEERSVFCSQLAVRLGQRDLGEFFEEHLGEGSVRDVRIVTDKYTKRSKGVGYVEFESKELVPKAIALTDQVIFGIPIKIQMTEAARNRADPAMIAEATYRPNLGDGVGSFAIGGGPIHLSVPGGSVRKSDNVNARLYVGSLHFNLTDHDIKTVFEPFGPIDEVNVHRETGTGKSKGFAFVQFRETADAAKALEAMNGFELAGRNIRVGHVNSRSVGMGEGSSGGDGGQEAQAVSSLDEGGGGRLTNASRASLMEKLARGEASAPVRLAENNAVQNRPASIPQEVSAAVLLKNMFNPEEETERDWDQELAEDVKGECENKYGSVSAIHVEVESAGEIYIKFADKEAAIKALDGLNGRWFGGRLISALFISESFWSAKFG